MSHFQDSPTHEIVVELIDRIEHSNGLDFVTTDDILKLRSLLDAHINDPATQQWQTVHVSVSDTPLQPKP